jgi:hypothetical protein
MTKQKTNRYKSRNVKKTKRHGQRRKTRRITTKRGGMLSRLSTISPRIYFIHNVLPLFTEFTTYMNPNPNPRPEDKSIVNFGERHYSSFADIPVDEALKASIRELQKDWNTEKSAEKALNAYNKLLQTYEDAKKRQIQKENRYTPPLGQTFSHPLSASLASIAPASLRSEPFGTPRLVESSNAFTPQKVSGDEKIPESIMTPSTGMLFAPTLANPSKTVRRLFGDDGDDDGDNNGDDDGGDITPISSPMKSPPPLSSKSSKRPLLSPSKPPRFQLG